MGIQSKVWTVNSLILFKAVPMVEFSLLYEKMTLLRLIFFCSAIPENLIYHGMLCQKIKLIREETGALITTPGEHEEHVFIIEAPPEIAMRVAQHLTTRAQEITQSKLSAGERRRGSTSSQINGLDQTGGANLLASSGNCFNTSGSGVAGGSGGPSSQANTSTGLLVPNGSGPSSLLSLSHSATNSPLHPSAGGSSLMSTGANSNVNGRVGCNGLFSHLSSLPNSPCGNGTGSLSGHGQSSLFLSNGLQNSNGNGMNGGGAGGMLNAGNGAQPGSRILLARSRISVPQELVGKIIGTQGSIITTIQKDTGTEIKSPPKEAARGPNATSEFEISAYQGLGLTSIQAADCRVQQAKQLIGHLVMRQLERRASEEIEDTSGCANLGSDDSQRLGSGGTPRSGMCGSAGPGNGSGSNNVNTPGWMWPDVAQMDSQEAREVLDRILAESKNKTRRAKELAAAAAAASPGSGGPIGGGSGPSPTSGCPISALNMVGCSSVQTSGFCSSSDQTHGSSSGPSVSSPHQRFHASSQLLVPSVNSLLDPSGS
ncbi:unnamed protein product, partial [Echinostoma caproni]|uniref:KH domain-containing protein n=1 Tax=Echinostoma caproni TaxID=27848 RepID=A0A183B8E8_9TREM